MNKVKAALLYFDYFESGLGTSKLTKRSPSKILGALFFPKSSWLTFGIQYFFKKKSLNAPDPAITWPHSALESNCNFIIAKFKHFKKKSVYKKKESFWFFLCFLLFCRAVILFFFLSFFLSLFLSLFLSSLSLFCLRFIFLFFQFNLFSWSKNQKTIYCKIWG